MKHWQKHRIVAMFLLAVTLVGLVPMAAPVSYADNGVLPGTETGNKPAAEDTYGGRTLEEIYALTQGMSYNLYRTTHKDKTAAKQESTRKYSAIDCIVPKGEINPTTGKVLTDSDYDTTFVENDAKGNPIHGVYMPSRGKTSFKITVPESGMYSIDLNCFPVAWHDVDKDGVKDQVSTKTTIERMFYIDGELPFNECRYLYIPRSWRYVGTNGIDELFRNGEPKRTDFESDSEYKEAYENWLTATETLGGGGNYEWDKDIQNNDIRPDRLESPMWRVYFLRDWLGYTVEPFQFYLEEGDHYFTLEATREPLVISDITIYGYYGENTYEYYADRWQSASQIYEGDDVYIVEAESPTVVSDQVLFPGTDRTSCINSPSHPSDLVYNLIQSGVVGQYMQYRVYVKEDGLYNIMARFRQNTMAGMFTSRRIRINGEIPFKEASYLKFNYDTSFQNQMFGYKNEEGEIEPYLFHLNQGWNTIEMEVVLGDMSQYIYDIANVISTLNSVYQKILTITGPVPDAYREYGFKRLIPEKLADLATCAIKVDEIYKTLIELTGATGQHIVTLDTIRVLLEKMAKDEYEIAPNFLSFKNYITALSNWLYGSLGQPLKLDHLRIQSPNAKMPKARANFFYAIAYEAKSFIASFTKDYNVIGFKTDNNAAAYDGTILMWNTTSREDALILRTMIDSGFTPNSNIAVNIKYVAQGLQESILAGVGPDVAMMASGTAVSWGIRHAVEELSAYYTQEDADEGRIPEGKQVGDEVYEGFHALCPRGEDGEFVIPTYDESKNGFDVQFSNAALEAVSLNGKTYLLPTTMNFEMAFYRVDIFAAKELKPPRTWQELHKVLPQLGADNMTMGMQTSLAGYQMILYQMGEEMYANDYQSFNESTTAREAFDVLCELFNSYSLPIAYDLTRFRTGEIPIVVANWTTYNTFMGYYELRGMWTMESLIGYGTYDKDGKLVSVDRSSILNVEGIVIPRGSENPQHVWQYMKWYAADDAQVRLARQRLAVSANTTAKYNTANLNALVRQAWTSEEKAAMLEEIPYLKGIPFNPGDYNIGRYVNFAFLAAYNTKANAVDSLLNYVIDIDKELSRKREEYHLPFIDYYNRNDNDKDDTTGK